MIFCESFGGVWIVAVCIILYNILLENPWAGFILPRRGHVVKMTLHIHGLFESFCSRVFRFVPLISYSSVEMSLPRSSDT